LADRLNFADLPRPFKNPNFVSKLAARTASSSTTVVRKGVKQILALERERLSGGDGFLTASQTQQKLRGQPIDPAGKKKATGTGYVRKGRGNIGNFKKGRLGNLVGSASGTTTPADGEDSVMDSRRTTPVEDEDDELAVPLAGGLLGDGFDDITPKGEIITCELGLRV
jgi:INO80 complex subunit C